MCIRDRSGAGTTQAPLAAIAAFWISSRVRSITVSYTHLDVYKRQLLSSQVRRRIVDLVRHSPGRLAAADLSSALELHVTTVRFHLDQLEQAGVLRSDRERRRAVGRPRKVYDVAPETKMCIRDRSLLEPESPGDKWLN